MPRGKYKKRDASIYEVPAPGSRMLCYVRFSGEDQDSASQEAAMRGWVDRNGWMVHPGDWYKDEARSGSSTDGRAAFASMIRTAERLSADPAKPAGVAVWRFNRFARDYQDAQFYKAHLRRMGYSLVSMADDVPSGDFAPIIESLLDWKAQHDNEQMSQDIRRTFSELRAQGYEPGGHPPRGLMLQAEPLGTKTNGKTRYGRRWVADPDLAPRIAQAFGMRAAIAGYTAIMSGPLHGVYKSASCLPTFFENHRYVAAGVVTEDTFRQVQAVAVRHARKIGEAHPRRIASAWLLSGLATCRCGAPMAGTTSPGPRASYRYYRCTTQMNRRDSSCDQRRISAEELDRAVLDEVLTCLDGSEQLATLTEAVNGELAADDGVASATETTRLALGAVESAIARLLDALERDGYGLVRDRLKAKEAERRKLREALLLMEAQAAAEQHLHLTTEDVAAALADMRKHRDAKDTQELRAALRVLVNRVVVNGEHYQIVYRSEVSGVVGGGGDNQGVPS